MLILILTVGIMAHFRWFVEKLDLAIVLGKVLDQRQDKFTHVASKCNLL